MKPGLQSYNNIFIIGMPGSGKTTFANIYSRFSKRTFLDFDVFFERTLNTKISKVFQTKGIKGFREMESRVLQLLVNKTNHVIALGGGTLLSDANYQFASRHGIIAALIDLPIETLADRIWNDKVNSKIRTRPLFAKCDTMEQVRQKVKQLQEERAWLYEKADILLNQKYNSIDNLVLTLLNAEQNFDK